MRCHDMAFIQSDSQNRARNDGQIILRNRTKYSDYEYKYIYVVNSKREREKSREREIERGREGVVN